MTESTIKRLTPARSRLLFLGILFVVACAGVLLWPKVPSSAIDPFPLTPPSVSPYLNTGSDAAYVGSTTCQNCHEDRHTTFRATGMGLSMAEINLRGEPPDAAFEHPPSKRRYQVVRRDGQMWHRELLITSGQEVVLAEYPMKYVIGSGRHSRSYLVEADGFLVESPITWYSAKKVWGMSPGYERPDQRGFERPTGEGCLHCHSGRAEAIGNSFHKMHVHEPAIACERCHGPGSLHIQKQAGRGSPLGPCVEADLTIVNPSRLSRELAEAVCQQCHLRCTAMVATRGHKISDFRPGLPLSDFIHAYMLESPGRKMTVVGHVEQMHHSRCYQASETLSCLTCHSPHSEPPQDAKAAHYRSVCQQCHKPERCTVEPKLRMRESPANDCIQCHMPRSPTEIPHLAFTHHRIGIHPQGAPDFVGNDAELKEFLDLSRHSEADRKRSLGLGYMEAASREKSPALANRFRERGVDVLSKLLTAGLRDGGLETGLARLRFELDEGDALPHARAALEQPHLLVHDRCDALSVIAEEQLRRGHYAEAATALRELTQNRRIANDWLLLAQSEFSLGNRPAEDSALQNAVRIDPRLWKVHQELAERARQQGDHSKAAWHKLRAIP